MDPPPDAMPPDADLRPELVVTPTGNGTVTAPGLTCSAVDCRGRYEVDTQVTVHAELTNGSNLYFAGWGGDCAGILRDCMLTMSASRAVTAAFATQTHNLVFLTSVGYSGDLGGVTAYDQRCNERATAAGINNAAGTGFIAFISDGTAPNSIFTRLDFMPGVARHGFIRMDGRPVATRLEDEAASLVYNQPSFTEIGTRYARDVPQYVWTGTPADGITVVTHCVAWTNPGSAAKVGYMGGGPGLYVEGTDAPCNVTRPVRCVGVTKNEDLPALPAVPSGGKIVFVTLTEVQSTANMTQTCVSEAATPLPGRTFVALRSTTGAPASSLVSPTATYYRPDGVKVGTGAQLVTGDELDSGIWLRADGLFVSRTAFAWTGSPAPNVMGTLDTTCQNWGSTLADPVHVGAVNDASRWWREEETTQPRCSANHHVYCIEQ